MTIGTSERPTTLLTPLEVANELRCSRSKVYELLATGAIPGALKVGGSVRINRAALEAWIAEQSRLSVADASQGAA